MLVTGAAATAVTASLHVFAQQRERAGAVTAFCEKGDARIRYQEIGSGFPVLLAPGGGLNSQIGNWPTAVFNARERPMVAK
jgi:hypothetical protein